MPENKKKFNELSDLVSVMETLLAPDGCPWDREQTPKTLAPYAIEEAHELAEAIEKEDIESTKEELGDLLLQVVFHASLAKRLGQFSLEDVIESICTKMIRRHPHVFADSKVKDSEEVLKNWAQIKALEKEKKKAGSSQSPFDIPPSLPALQRAQKIGDKTKTLKFDWQNPDEVLAKVDEEYLELKEALKEKDPAHIEEELGDLFFVLAQLARHLKLEAESVARKANRKFEGRFQKLLNLALTKGLDFNALPLDQKEALWEEIKKS